MSLAKAKQIIVLGSTGSIGVNALDVVRRLNKKNPGSCRIIGLAARNNLALLKKQIQEFRPAAAALWEPGPAAELRSWAKAQKISLDVWEGAQGLERLAAHPKANFVLSAVVGAVGLAPLMAAVEAGKKIALANKEALIIAGDLIMERARKTGAQVIPVDSEHSAIFQCLAPGDHGRVRRLILTASGGAFYRRQGSLDKVTVKEALAHPTWKMGRKITVDCATLANKGLEAIEAHHLFGVPLEKIRILIHPQSIIHSLVEFTDGAMLAQLSHPDMRLPIQYALTHPDRSPTPVKPLELEQVQKLEFQEPDFRRFPSLALALSAGKKGGVWPALFNGANEAAVQAFLDEKIAFSQIPRLVSRVLKTFRGPAKQNHPVGLTAILEADQWSRQKAASLVEASSPPPRSRKK